MVILSGVTWPLTAGLRSILAFKAVVLSETVVMAVCTVSDEAAMLGVFTLAVVSDVSTPAVDRISR